MSEQTPEDNEDLANPDLKPDDLVIKSSAPKYIPIHTIIRLFTEHPTLSIPQAADLLHISKQALYERLRRAEYTPERMREFAKYRKATYEYLEAMMVNALTPAKINKLPTQALVWSLGVIGDKRRLEEGKSTANVQALHAHITLEGSKTDELMKRIEGELKKRKELPDKPQSIYIGEELKDLAVKGVVHTKGGKVIDVFPTEDKADTTPHPTGEAQEAGRAEVIPRAGESTEKGVTVPSGAPETTTDEQGQGDKGG